MSVKTSKPRAEPPNAVKAPPARPKRKPNPPTKSAAAAAPTLAKALPSDVVSMPGRAVSQPRPSRPASAAAAGRSQAVADGPAAVPVRRKRPVPATPPAVQPSAADSGAAATGAPDTRSDSARSRTTAVHPAAAASAKDGTAAVAPAAVASVTEEPVGASTALKQLLALTVNEGLFVVVAASATSDPVQAFARYEDEPFPRFINEPGHFSAKTTQAGPVVYTAFLPWPGVRAGTLKLGYITEAGRRPLLNVDALALAELPPYALAAMVSRFGRVLMPAAIAVLPSDHALRLALQSQRVVAEAPLPPPPSVRCHFDGVIDGLAHGWAFDSAQPNKVLRIEVVHEGEVVASGLADRYREDLERIGFGDGRHHFRLKLSYALFDGQPHVLSLRVVESGAAAPSPPLTCTLDAAQPVHLDPISRAQTLILAQRLGPGAQAGSPDAEQAVLHALRQCCLQQETWQLEQARAGYQRLAETLGANALCHCKIGETWLLEHQLARALDAYSAAVQLDPELAWAHLGLGNVLLLQGYALESRAAFRAALSIDPELTAAQRRLASVQADALTAGAMKRLQAGDKAGAITQLQVAVFEQPEHEGACSNLDALLRDPQSGHPGDTAGGTEIAEQAARARRLLDAMLDEAERRLAGSIGEQRQP